MSSEKPSLSLSLPSEVANIEHPFDGDVLDRKQMAVRLTGYIGRLRAGAVVAVDGHWGEGKSWFGRNWGAFLRQEGHKVAYIDAFQQDYIEDPFLLIAAEIANLVDKPDELQKIQAGAAAVMKALMPIATKALINLAGKVVLGNGDVVGEFADAAKAVSDEAADTAGSWVKQKIEDHEQEKQSLTHFRETLAAFAHKEKKPVVIFVDELDRCRPSFAVRLIERIKHFFEVPNLVFVLLLNRDQLEKAIRGVYGAETDASAYLGKFLHLTWKLPKHLPLDVNERQHTGRIFVAKTMEQFGFDSSQRGAPSDFVGEFSVWVSIFNLSLRDVQRGCSLFVLADTSWSGMIAYIIALKIARPIWFEGLRTGSTAVHKECEVWLDSLTPDGVVARDWPSMYFQALSSLHRSQYGEPSPERKATLVESQAFLFGHRTGFGSRDPFKTCIGKIDLTVEPH